MSTGNLLKRKQPDKKDRKELKLNQLIFIAARKSGSQSRASAVPKTRMYTGSAKWTPNLTSKHINELKLKNI